MITHKNSKGHRTSMYERPDGNGLVTRDELERILDARMDRVRLWMTELREELRANMEELRAMLRKWENLQ